MGRQELDIIGCDNREKELRGQEVWFHAEFTTKHVVKQGTDGTKFLCGKKVGDAYRKGGASYFPLCAGCRKSLKLAEVK